MPDRQPRVQPKNATVVPTKSADDKRMTMRATAAARSPDLADESAEQTAAAIRERLASGNGSDDSYVSLDR